MDKQKHKCGVCKAVFSTENGYLTHTCEASGKMPTNVMHLVSTTSPNFQRVSDAATRRAKERMNREIKKGKNQ